MLSEMSLLLLLILGVVGVSTKPIDDISSKENVNEVDTAGSQGDYKEGVVGVRGEVDVTDVVEIPRPFPISLSNEQTTWSANNKRISTSTTTTSASGRATTSSTITAGGADNVMGSEKLLGNLENTTGDISSTRQQGFAWFLAPFTQKVQFSPQTFFQDKIGQLKDTLINIGSIFPNQQNDDDDDDGGGVGVAGGTKQFVNGGLVNLVGLNDSGFYTNRLDPVGFFGGNGWFANKGGIIGGPGAFVSTGSLLTDYQTPYKK